MLPLGSPCACQRPRSRLSRQADRRGSHASCSTLRQLRLFSSLSKRTHWHCPLHARRHKGPVCHWPLLAPASRLFGLFLWIPCLRFPLLDSFAYLGYLPRVPGPVTLRGDLPPRLSPLRKMETQPMSVPGALLCVCLLFWESNLGLEAERFIVFGL